LLPLIDMNNENAPQIPRPNSILKWNSHKRSCSTGLYHYFIDKNHIQNIQNIGSLLINYLLLIFFYQNLIHLSLY
jgi:hypothetical protein